MTLPEWERYNLFLQWQSCMLHPTIVVRIIRQKCDVEVCFLFKSTYYHRHVGCKILIELQCPIPQWGCPTERISSGKAWVNKHFLEGKQEKPTVFAKVIIPGLPAPMEISQMQEFQICLWYSELLGCTSYKATVQVAPLHSYLHPGAQALAYVPWQLQHRGCVT